MSEDDIAFADTPESKELEAILTEGPGQTESPLAHSWRYLQVYTNWGVKLPTEDAEFARLFHSTNLAEFDFYPDLKDGCVTVSKASADFNENLLPEVIGVGNSLSVFAENAADGEGEMFQELINMVKPEDDDEKPDLESAKEILTDMIAEAQEATDKVKEVQSKLGAFKTELTKASGKFKTAKQTIDKNDAINEANIKKLTDPGLDSSLSKLNELRKKLQEDYDFNKNVAATTPTYAWVLPAFPVGLVCAVTVAAIYGPRASALADQLEDLDAQIKTANVDLSRALKVQTTYDAADTAAAQLVKHTDAALRHTTTVQNGWNGISKNLEGLRKAVEQTMRESDGEQQLKSASVLKVKLKRAGDWWTKMVDPLRDLGANPYIYVEPGEMEMADFAASVRKEAA